MMPRCMALTALFALTLTTVAEPQPCDLAVAAMRRALCSRAAWTMERRLHGAARTLVSTGIVDCLAGRSISWRAIHPFASSVEMTADAMLFSDDDGVRVKPLDEMPGYAEMRSRTDDFARGDGHALDGLFAMGAFALPDGGWRLSLVPESRAMLRLLQRVELSGGETLTNAVLWTGGGGVSSIRFTEIPRDR